MTLITRIFAALTAAEFFYIFFLETIATTSEKTAKVFGMDVSELKRPSVTVLFKNQGVYNALIGVLILVAVFAFSSVTALIFLLLTIVAVALYGSVTSNPKILLMQGGIAMITLITWLF